MLRRSTKVQLILFVIITLVGLSYVSAQYIGLTRYILNDGCTVYADFADSGGIFTNAEVTYRGVTVGRVGDLELEAPNGKDLPKGGVQVALDLDNCSDPKIPASSSANIHNRSVVGEQYVDLVPAKGSSNDGPFLGSHALIPAMRDGKQLNTTPVPTQDILLHLDQLVKSVPLDALSTTVTELYKAVANRGTDLGTLLDSANTLLKTANEPDNLQATLALLRDSSSVLQTQLDKSDALTSWTHSLNLLAQQLKKSDPDIRRLLDDGPAALTTVDSFIKNNQTDIGVVLANLSTVGNMLVQHLDGIEEIFELYPALAAGGQSFLRENPNDPGKKYGMLGLVLQATPEALKNGGLDPPDCGDPKKGQQGYGGTVRRTPGQVSPAAANVAARCTASPGSNTNVRGSANVPGGDPVSVSGAGYAYDRSATSNTVQIGPTFTSKSVVNDGRYLTMLTASLG